MCLQPQGSCWRDQSIRPRQWIARTGPGGLVNGQETVTGPASTHDPRLGEHLMIQKIVQSSLGIDLEAYNKGRLRSPSL